LPLIKGQDIDKDSLMIDALNKYNSIKKEGQWNALTPEQEKLVTLAAQFEQLKDKNLQLSKRLQVNGNPKSNKSKGKNKKHKKPDFKKKSNSKSLNKDDEAWKKIPPKDNESKTKSVNGSEYIWCSEHLAWEKHHLGDCRLYKKRMEEDQNTHASTTDDVSAASTMNELQAILGSE